ncbi:hypothetical protein MTHERMMSTA1_22770 [Methanosarcina thermophila MST-A1]|uniref:Uncharacterized protein n=1 Tax=Methanosarcina thermophila TaxID=2210 RepID=A0A3G9CUJ9_METTE|nr:putative conserved hypothetical protein [Methanosarcina thermophila]GLI15151.1 hypothetical protein MTHERMMSTA1_22770 [Methanosarcina thermophila MST-A1]
MILTISGKIDETIKKYSVAEIKISDYPCCGINFFQFFFGFNGKQSPQVIVR